MYIVGIIYCMFINGLSVKICRGMTPTKRKFLTRNIPQVGILEAIGHRR